MTSKSKSISDSWGLCMPMEGLAFRYDRDEEITRYIRMRDILGLTNLGICTIIQW